MSYFVDDEKMQVHCGPPFCDKCDSVLTRETMAGKYFCPKCDKEEMEQSQRSRRDEA